MAGIRKTVDELIRRTGRMFIVDCKNRHLALIELVGREEFQRTPWRRSDTEFIADVEAYTRLSALPAQMELL
jgi:hypothetical protein